MKKNSEISEKYGDFCRPKLASQLNALRLDVPFHRASGDYLYYFDNEGKENCVIDFLGGFGSTLFGHNNQELLKVAKANYENMVPFSSQASCRSGAALLCEKLNEMMHARTGKNVITTLASTGAEAVEAAIKHAELSHYNKIEKIKNNMQYASIKLKQDYKDGRITFSSDFTQQVRSKIAVAPNADFCNQLRAIEHYNYRIFKKAPCFFALQKSFHGKTTGSVKLTYNEEFRVPFSRIGLNVIFIEPCNTDAVYKAIDKNTINYYWPEVNDSGEIILAEKKHVNVSAFFIETLQGEGGINIIPTAFVKFCREIADIHDFPLIFDEIQSGMGRTGTFLFSEQTGVVADYYMLSKSLGGGLSKISAMMVDRTLYEEDFGVIHSSTFAEDDHSANIALAALNLLDNDSSIMQNCVDRGAYIKRGLEKIREQFPDVIQDIRGAGLMLGVQFARQDQSGSVTIRGLSAQNVLCMVIAGYLFHEHRIRVAPPMSNGTMIRIEPSAYINEENCDKLVCALAMVCEIIYKQNAYFLTRFLLGAEKPGIFDEIKDYRREFPVYEKPRNARKVAFIGHLVKASHLREWDESLSEFNDQQLEYFIQKLSPYIEPRITELHTIKSITGDLVNLNFIGILLDSRTIGMHILSGDVSSIKKSVDKAVEIAEDHGCEVIGFGGYSSIVTRNCTDVITDSAALTTGNSFTVAMGVEALYKSAAECGMDISTSCLAAIGANGNICSVYSEIIAERVPRIILLGRPGKEERLKDVAGDIYYNALMDILAFRSIITEKDLSKSRIFDGHADTLQGVARIIYETDTVSYLLQHHSKIDNLGMWILEKLTHEMGQNVPVIMTSDYNSLKEANLIVAASNSVGPVIFPEMLGKGPIVICDIAVPEDTDLTVVKTRDDVTVIKGGIVKLPLNPDFKINGLPLDAGTSFACLAETTLLGLTGITEHYSYGRIDKNKVKKILDIAHIHGYSLARVKTEKSY